MYKRTTSPVYRPHPPDPAPAADRHGGTFLDRSNDSMIWKKPSTITICHLW